ncbi:MAG TPA: F0F1 ATP synthase subunit B [Cryobacterium sp.]|nr:F0F1 ATP synthase subunit B [Cryobacterium sp.]
MPELVLAAEADTNPFLPAIYDITWSAVVFLVVMVFFVRFAIPRFRQILDDRAEAIEGNIAKADDAQRKAEAALEQYTSQLAEARAEAGKIRDAARADGQTIVNELKEQAVAAAARVTATAKAQIEAERQAAVVSLRSEVGTLAIDLASGVIGESLTDDAKASAIVDRFLADLDASEKVAR